jgi:hypothetical protein
VSEPERWATPGALEEVQRLVEGGMPVPAIAARFGLEADELYEDIDAGRHVDAPEPLVKLEQVIRLGEAEYQLRLIAAVQDSKNWMGPMKLLEARFKKSWGKDAKPPRETVVKVEQSDDDVLQELLNEGENGKLWQLLKRNGIGRLP